MKTKNGIYLNLKESEYKIEQFGYIFYFSSEFYLNKFKVELKDYLQMENSKIIMKYKINIDLSNYLAVSLYKRIEKRGFYIENFQGHEIKNINFDALDLTI